MLWQSNYYINFIYTRCIIYSPLRKKLTIARFVKKKFFLVSLKFLQYESHAFLMLNKFCICLFLSGCNRSGRKPRRARRSRQPSKIHHIYSSLYLSTTTQFFFSALIYLIYSYVWSSLYSNRRVQEVSEETPETQDSEA